MQELKINLDFTINSGQVFLWDKFDEGWYGINGLDVLRISQNPFTIMSFHKNAYDIFRQSDDFEKILENISKDNIVRSAVQSFPGLRLMRQDPFQCYISFICSSNSSIPNIKQMLQKICKKFGERIYFDGYEFFNFPQAEKLASASLRDLRMCGLGFRAKAVKKASLAIVSGKINFEHLKKSDYKTAKKKLKEVYGIGDKIADCILLFSLEKLEAFPLDRWTQRILQKYYSNKFYNQIVGSLTEKKYEDAHEKIVEYFGPFAGYSQQFLFKMERELNNGKWL